MKTFILAAAGLFAWTSIAVAEPTRIESAHDVTTTVDRLAAAVEAAGAKVFARIDHAKGAASVDMELAPATLLIFGNPKLGTPAMQAAPTMGLDLPLRVLAYRDGDTVWLAYHAPAEVAAQHRLPANHPAILKMTGALAKLTAEAAAK